MSDDALVPAQGAHAELAALYKGAATLQRASIGAGTQLAYDAAWKQFLAWCAGLALDPYAPETVPLYVAHLATVKKRALSTIRVAVAAITVGYKKAGFLLTAQAPELGSVIKGTARTLGSAPGRQAAPISVALLRVMLAHCDRARQPARAARDRALLLLGFGAALRRSEIVALCRDDVKIEGRGVRITIGRSKTDQTGRGVDVGIVANPADPEFCAAVALEAWLAFREQGEDMQAALAAENPPLFCSLAKNGKVIGKKLSERLVARLVKKLAMCAGEPPEDYAGHSLRAGLITAAAEGGGELPGLQKHARHANPASTTRYFRPATIWRANVTALVFREEAEESPI